MRKARPLACALAATMVALAAPAARADGPRPLRGDLAVDVPLTAATLVLWGGSDAAKRALAPARCRVCGTNALDAAARDLLLARDVRTPRRASDVLAYAVFPAGVAASQLLAARGAGDVREGARDLLYVAEAAGIAGALNQAVKFAVGRERPFVHSGDGVTPDRPHDADDDLSFYSGHTSFAFSLATAAGTISHQRGYRSTPWVFGVGLTLATAVGYLRIAGDEHWLTDVLAGAAVGSAVGVGVPLWLHRRKASAPPDPRASTAPAMVPLGIVVVF